ncbi:cytochrome P450 [Aspergillus aurantiobrunneus]
MVSDVLSYVSGLDAVEILAVFLLPVVLYLLAAPKRKQLPLVNGRSPFEFSDAGSKQRFLSGAPQLIKSGLQKASVFRLISDNGEKTVLSRKYAKEIRSHPALDFNGSIAEEFHANVRGFEPFKQGTQSDELVQTAVRTKLTQSLGGITEPLSAETSLALEKEWTNNEGWFDNVSCIDWHDLALKPSILKIVARLSSRVFLGDQICRNPDWLRITVSYTVDSFLAAMDLRQWPRLVRSLVARFLPSCRKIRQELDEARSIIRPVLEERRQAKEAAGDVSARFNDAMQWMEDVAKGRPYDAAVAQMSFSLAAIHTTSDMLTQVLFDLCGKGDIIQALREELTAVIQRDGWKKTTLYQLKLMDSVVKESQRLKPIGIASMRRLVTKDIQLSDGTLLQKGTTIMVSGDGTRDPSVYPNPETFDAYRFLKLRETPGHETSAQLVSPSPEHLGFGYGNHACPGRFFAANEVKIALAHILLKYDFKLAPGAAKPSIQQSGISWNANATAKISIRRRQEEISL